jgi:hypothetical protein
MAQVILRRGASLRGVKKVSIVSPEGSRRGSNVRVVFRSSRRWRDETDDLIDGDVRVTIVNPNTGVIRKAEIDDSGPRRKRRSRALRPFERAVRRMMKRQFRVSKIYLERHDRSNRTKRNGWLKDLSKNMVRATRDADD